MRSSVHILLSLLPISGCFFTSYFSMLKIEPICSSETSVDFQRTTWRYILEDSTLQLPDQKSHFPRKILHFTYSVSWEPPGKLYTLLINSLY
jgi:hypothetical protein